MTSLLAATQSLPAGSVVAVVWKLLAPVLAVLATVVLLGVLILIGIAAMTGGKRGVARVLDACLEVLGGQSKAFPKYGLRPSLLSQGELAFYNVLREAVSGGLSAGTPPSSGSLLGGPPLRGGSVPGVGAQTGAGRVGAGAGSVVIFAKVRLEDLLIVPDRGDLSRHQSARGRVKSRHLDFVLCDAATTRPLLAIELDDRSHDRERSRHGDETKNKALESAGLPMLRVKASSRYSVEEVRGAVGRAMAEPVGNPGSRVPVAAGATRP